MISFLLFSLVDECLGSFLSHKIGVSPYQAKSSSLCSSLKGNADVLHFVCVLSVSSVKSGSSSVSGSVSGSECTLGGGLGVFARFLPLVAFFGGEGGTESTVGHSICPIAVMVCQFAADAWALQYTQEYFFYPWKEQRTNGKRNWKRHEVSENGKIPSLNEGKVK